ncbi:hypothetical protein CDAR_73472 [Caerostris darwini]|uniref:Uncharacterized protein n=1 Tax=Caerostris darwini TaxID=1538125 RepID=A0AAV4VKF0_9ARAC|nr:hypothetical protein CDAR_73472 [Caerostris darwini]
MRRLNCPRQSPSQHRLPDFLFPERLFLPHLPCRFTHNLEKPAAGNPESKNQTDRKPDALPASKPIRKEGSSDLNSAFENIRTRVFVTAGDSASSSHAGCATEKNRIPRRSRPPPPPTHPDDGKKGGNDYVKSRVTSERTEEFTCVFAQKELHLCACP